MRVGGSNPVTPEIRYLLLLMEVVDGQTINVVLPKLLCCTMGLKSIYIFKKHNDYSSAMMAERTKMLKHPQLMSECIYNSTTATGFLVAFFWHFIAYVPSLVCTFYVVNLVFF